MKVGTDGVLLGSWTSCREARTILDIGTGTGLLAIMLAQKTDAQIDAIEIEPNAYSQATENVKNSPWQEKIKVIQSSFQDFFKISENKYDLIVSNPPFFSNSLKTPHETRNLARHNDLLPPEDLLRGVYRMMEPQGRFCVIMPYIDSSLFVVEAAMNNLYCTSKLYVKPSPKKKVTRVLMEFGRNRSKVQEAELIIQTEEGHYTEDYKTMTKDYYLFL